MISIKGTAMKFRNSKLLVNTSRIASGTIISQIIAFVSTAINSRYYAPEYYGSLAKVLSISGLVAGLTTLGLTSAIIISDSDEDARGLCRLIVDFTLLVCIFLSLGNVMFYKHIKFMPFQDHYFTYLTLTMFIIVINNYCTVKNAYINRLGEFKIIFFNTIIQASVNLLTTLFLAVNKHIEFGLIVGNICGILSSAVYMRIRLGKDNYQLTPSGIKHIAKKYKDYLKYQYFAAIFSSFASQYPNLLISRYFGDVVLGYYAMSQRLLAVPVSILGSSLGKVFIKEASDITNKQNDLRFFLYNHIKTIMILSVIPISILVAAGDVLVPIFLGNDWVKAGQYIQILAIYYIFVFVMNSTLGLPSILGMQKENMVFSLVCFAVNIMTVFVIGTMYHGNDILLMLFVAITNSCEQIIFYSMMLKKVSISVGKYLKLIFVSTASIFVFSFLLRLIVDIFVNK